MDATFDYITVTDENGVFLKVSKSCEEIFGVSESEVIGVSAYDLEKRGIFSHSATIEALKNKKKITLVQETASGKRLFVTGIPMFNEDGKVKGIINITKDITENERLKKQLEEAEYMLECFRKEDISKQIKGENVILGNSISMKKIIDLIQHIANIDTTVILLGETGVGKSFIAKMIHKISKRRNQPFIQINCGAIPESLLESELFGYEEGAFTGAAKTGKKGLFEVAGEGTIFLDEIGELSLQLQVKLLNVLQEKQAYKVGSIKPFNIKARIISATNKDLKKLVQKGKFREDLYYRINIVPVTIPPLRERVDDIPIFIKHFLEKYNKKYNLSKQISAKSVKMLTLYNWPGNIRELENTVERLIVTCNKSIIEESYISNIIKPYYKYIYEINESMPLKKAKEELEKQILLKSLEVHKTTRKIAEVLKVDQSTVVKKLKKIREEKLNDDINHRF